MIYVGHKSSRTTSKSRWKGQSPRTAPYYERRIMQTVRYAR
jgi:hypothetical protein